MIQTTSSGRVVKPPLAKSIPKIVLDDDYDSEEDSDYYPESESDFDSDDESYIDSERDDDSESDSD